MSAITDVLDSLSIPYRKNGYEPRKPPSGPYYATVREVETDYGGDFKVFARRISTLVTLYDAGTSECEQMRATLHDAFSGANLKHTMSSTDYFTDEKIFMTEYDFEDRIERKEFV